MPNQWALINRMLLIYKVAAASVSAVALILTGIIFYQAVRGPIVVLDKCDDKSFFQGRYQILKVTEPDVKRFIENWISLRYAWSEFDPDKIIRNIEPWSTQGFTEKLRDLFGKKKKSQDPKPQKIEESVTNIKVNLGDREALATFDQIVRINGIPIVVPSEVSMQIIQGSSTRFNPLGLYVDGLIEHEEK